MNTTLILGAGNIMAPYVIIPSVSESKGFFTVAKKWSLVACHS